MTEHLIEPAELVNIARQVVG